MHDPESMGEPGMLCGREDPPRALELADPAQTLHPGRVEQIVLGRVLDPESDRPGLVGPKVLRKLDISVDRVADEIDCRKQTSAHGQSGMGVERDVGPGRSSGSGVGVGAGAFWTVGAGFGFGTVPT